MKEKIGLYVHVPFCKAKCNYCDFNSYSGRDNLIEDYFNAVVKQALDYGGRLTDRRVKSIYIGGGTPSYVDGKYIALLMDTLYDCFDVEKDIEITIEANPGTLTPGKLYDYKAGGINRLSVGLQACQNEILGFLGRIHSMDDFHQSIDEAVKAGFQNISADLIFGIPGQDASAWKESLKLVTGLGLPHLSCYSLKFEEGTVFNEKLEKGLLSEVSDELDREMYYTAIEYMENRGYKHYEISNFAMAGFESRHNILYWKGEEYLGLGAGAHSYLNGARYGNTNSPEEFIKAVNLKEPVVCDEHIIDIEEKMKEFMLLGLRLVDGVSVNEFRQRFGREIQTVFGNKLDYLYSEGLIVEEDGFIRLTKPLGLDFANRVFMEFV